MKPKVSLLICVYNGGCFLRESVGSALGQTYENLEVVLIDDGSTDGAVQNLPIGLQTDPRLRIFHQPNRGKSGALNHGIRRCCGDFIALQDADDISLPSRVSVQMQAFTQHPSVSVAFCGHFLIWGQKHIAPIRIPRTISECRLMIDNFEMPGLDPTMIIRRSAAESCGFDTQLPVVEGYDFIMRLGETNDMLNIGECLYGYRVHLSSITKSDPAKRTKMLENLLRKTCARRQVDFESQFPAFVDPSQVSRLSAPLNDTLSHCAISAKSSILQNQRSESLRLFFWMLFRWPIARETYKAAAFAIVPRSVLKVFLCFKQRHRIRQRRTA